MTKYITRRDQHIARYGLSFRIFDAAVKKMQYKQDIPEWQTDEYKAVKKRFRKLVTLFQCEPFSTPF